MKHLSTTALASLMIGLAILPGCRAGGGPDVDRATIVQQESDRLNAWFAERFAEGLARSPMSQTYFGKRDNQDKLDDNSQIAQDEEAALRQNWLAEMRRDFDVDRLDTQTRLSYTLFEVEQADWLATHAVAQNDYVFQHMSGPHSSLPSFIINFHKIETEADARAYISRLNAFDDFLGQAEARAQAQANAGVLLPRFVYDKITSPAQNIITGAPFTPGDDSPLFKDFKAKLDASDIGGALKAELTQNAQEALLTAVKPAYDSMLVMFEKHAAMTTDEDGAWKLPNAEAYYSTRLKHYTTTDLTADEIHNIGLSEVARIQARMQDIMDRVEFDGSLQDFYGFLRSDPQFTYANDDDGRAAYITDATAIIDEMKARLDGLFLTKPKADMIVKRVEPFREATAFGAFYDSPALDGSRPGTYYINLKDMVDQPTFLQQALAYHEGIPGHHMQIAIAQELQGLPEFRALGGHTAFIEGWGLYAEEIPKELGLYTDPYKEFGQLGMEIFRAARLVVDTGIHAKKWTREEAAQYYLANIPNPEGDVRAEIDRYIVWPGQATAYMIGKLKIIELRRKAEAALGDAFDVREFHDAVLTNGSVPLDILEANIDIYIADKKDQ
ncbi:hypothetical protein GCM10009069_20610 [Algimonas arctica]|uniref:DUF885 domain-containing protein n=1 Tax=Algimonas arctica TaxID=1479486 RepID=A0A8J3CT54_9PROT|nr:DUF885 domain-containing protein [Algimonas arctica]GHA97592.1 hypothetical protein GCM10009069_20610 [Algimonas arctica]